MKKILLCAALSVVLSGCNQNRMGKAKQDFACSDDGGVYHYVSWGHKAQCNSGRDVNDWQDMILPPEFYPKKEQL